MGDTGNRGPSGASRPGTASASGGETRPGAGARPAASVAGPRRPEGPARVGAAGLPVLPPLSAIAEVVVLFALILLVDHLAPTLGVLDIEPHPFWLPVLLVSLQYGTVSGLLAASVAVGATFFTGLAEQDIGENHFVYFVRVWGEPILWIVAALTIGQFRMQQLARKQELARANATLTRQRDDLARHAGALRERCHMLEREIAAQRRVHPHVALAELAIMRMEQARDFDPATVAQRAEQVLGRLAGVAFPGSRVALFRKGEAGLVETAASGRSPGSGAVSAISRHSALYKAAIEERRRLSVLDARDEAVLQGIGAMAVPLTGSAGGEPTGLLVLEHAEPVAISTQGLLALEAIAAAIADAIDAPPYPKAWAGDAHRAQRPTDAAALVPRLERAALRFVPDGDAGRPLQDGDS